MVFSGKIYETDGVNAIATYEAGEVRPLPPVPQPASFRIFHSQFQPGAIQSFEPEDPRFFYGNPSCLVGASQLINHPEIGRELSFEPFIGAVLLSDAYKIDVEDADEIILGFTMITMLTLLDVRRGEVGAGGGFGRSYDIGAAIGPVVTTPDELDEDVTDQEFGRRYFLPAVARINSVDRQRGNTEDLPFTFAQIISAASQSCTLKEGDIIAMGPIVDVDDEEGPIVLDAGDEVHLAVGKLGTLSLKLSTPI